MHQSYPRITMYYMNEDAYISYHNLHDHYMQDHHVTSSEAYSRNGAA
jgi:hypothetical protein